MGKSHFSFIKLEVVFPSNGRSHFLFLLFFSAIRFISDSPSQQQKQQFFSRQMAEGSAVVIVFSELNQNHRKSMDISTIMVSKKMMVDSAVGQPLCTHWGRMLP